MTPLLLRALSIVSLLLVGSVLQVQADTSNICFLLYQNADNDLEKSLRDNLQQWMHSPAIRKKNVVTWVYFDALNNLSGDDENDNNKGAASAPTTPLEHVWTQDGSQLLTNASTTKYEGSYYMTYDHALEKMLVHKQLPDEVNSDDPATLWAFVGYAMQDCVGKNATDAMLVLNAYGAGSAGFGGDLHPGSGSRSDEPTTRRQLGSPQQEVEEVEGENRATAPVAPLPEVLGVISRHPELQKPQEILQQQARDKQAKKKKQQQEEEGAGIASSPAKEEDPLVGTGEVATGIRAIDQVEPQGVDDTVFNPPSVESNQNIVLALQRVLDDLEGGPDKFSVIGFDGHFMQTLNAVNQFRAIADHVLASESLMPEHGWAYSTLSDTWTAKALAQQVITEFVARSQHEDGTHSSPKTLSLIDTHGQKQGESNAGFPAFLIAFDDYLATVTTLLTEGKDVHFFTSLHRARSQAVSYEKDMVVDLGAFVEDIVNICNPSAGSELRTKSDRVWQTYNDMFVDRQYGPGTEHGTGMILDLPLIPTYRKDPSSWDGVLNENSANVPNFRPFFEAYVSAVLPTPNTVESVCQNKAELPSIANGAAMISRGTTLFPDQRLPTGSKGSLFVNSAITSMEENELVVETDLTVGAHSVNIYYGINVTSLMRRAMDEQNARPVSRHLRRHLKTIPGPAVDDFLVLYGGAIPGSFVNEGSDRGFGATWNREFHVVKDDGSSGDEFQAIFVDTPEDGEASKKIPVMFFDPYNKLVEQAGAVAVGTDRASAERKFGGRPGYVLFQTDDATGIESFTLYVEKCKKALQLAVDLGALPEDCKHMERTRQEEGFLAPIVPVRGMINGREIKELVGGFSGRVLNWTTSVPLKVETMTDKTFMETTQADKVVVEMVATSFEATEKEVYTFDILPSDSRQRGDPSQLAPVVYDEGDIPEGVDIAKCKPTIQSSTANDNIPRKAITGELAAISETECEPSPWWLVDLLTERPVNTVKIVNRQDCCMDNLEGLVVELLDEDDRSVAFVQHTPEKDGPFGAYWMARFDGINARKVRVSVHRPPGICTTLNLAAVQVYSDQCTDVDTCQRGMGCSFGNVAMCKPATQSSTIELDTSARNAVIASTALAHTKCEAEPWWEVDLNSERMVTQVAIKNREDCCFDRLNGLKLELYDSSNELTAYFHHNPADGEIKPMLIVHFDNVQTRKVRISVLHEADQCDFLNLEEVQVYSECIEGDACKTGIACPRL